MRLRQLALIWHRYFGLTFGLLLVILGLSGSALVFHREIDHALNPSLMQVASQVEQASIDTVLASVCQAYPNFQLQSITFPEPPGRTTYLVSLKPQDPLEAEQSTEVFVNPHTAEVLGSRQSDRHFIGFLYKLHLSLVAGEIGEMVVIICGLLLILLGLTGLILWPGWRNLARGFRIRWQASGLRVNYDIHNVWGFWSNVFLIIIGFTGSLILIAHHSPALTALFFGSTPNVKPTVVLPNQKPIATSKILQIADTVLPGGETTTVFFAELPEPKVTVHKKFPQEYQPPIHDFGYSTVEISQYSGKVLRVNKVVEPPPIGFKTAMLLGALHFGTFWGLPSQILYVLIGLVPTALFVTGFVMWRNHYRPKSDRPVGSMRLVRRH